MSLNPRSSPAPEATPSSFYSAKFWQLGLALARRLPPGITEAICRTAATLYFLTNRSRREVVVENLLPAVNGDRAKANRTARKLFQQFALKLVDLWRYESGSPVEDLFGEWTGWEHFQNAQNEKRGILLLTPHLGNWEFGAPLLAKRGVKLLVITLEEPDSKLTEMRKASRERWGIETLVLGRDTFAFVEIMRRLESGATVALLVDRPPVNTATTVELFGQPFASSISAAELARATNCILLPVYLPRIGEKYAAHILPQIPYDRPALRQPEARQKLTQEIMRAFEPVIRQHIEQWYHFVPIWQKDPDERR
ncbi:MAG: Lipid biosynthesis acyltransferase [Verrucomicrobiales bacterium]|nr:Lipid biosynthesis acyltransferase [Verrucomicrobiales bacterium]